MSKRPDLRERVYMAGCKLLSDAEVLEADARERLEQAKTLRRHAQAAFDACEFIRSPRP